MAIEHLRERGIRSKRFKHTGFVKRPFIRNRCLDLREGTSHKGDSGKVCTSLFISLITEVSTPAEIDAAQKIPRMIDASVTP